MNRREAIAALTALPAVARITKADLHPDDVIVVECSDIISQETAMKIKAQMALIWPGRQIVVFGRELRMKIVPKGQVS